MRNTEYLTSHVYFCLSVAAWRGERDVAERTNRLADRIQCWLCSLWPLVTEESSRVLHPKHFQRTHARTNDSVCPHGAGEHTRISLRPPLRSLPQSRWWGPSGGRSRGRSSRRQPACRGTLPTMPHPSPSSATIYTWNSRELAWSILPLQMPHFLEQLSSER